MAADRQWNGHWNDHGKERVDPAFARRMLVGLGMVLSIIIILLLIWYTIRVLVLIFMGILIAVFLRGISDWVSEWTRLPPRLSLTLVILFLSGLAGLGAWFLSPHLYDQLNRLADQLPHAIQRIAKYVEQVLGLGSAGQSRELISGIGGFFKKAETFFSFTLEALTDAVIVFFVSLYLAFSPEAYIKGVINLVPIGLRRNASDLIHNLGFTLKWWLVGIFMMMVFVGTLIGLGLRLLNIPLALTLGIIAGLLTFIPYFGPIFSAIPALLMALLVDISHVVYVGLLYLLIHILEGYILSPLVQERTVYLPPILTLSAITGMSILLGIPGLIIATPFTAVMLVLVKKIYIEGILGDKTQTRAES